MISLLRPTKLSRVTIQHMSSGFQHGPKPTELHRRRQWLEASNYGFYEAEGLHYLCSEYKGANTAQLICAMPKQVLFHDAAEIALKIYYCVRQMGISE